MAKPAQAQPARDWEAIERDYRSGQFTDREIGAKYGLSHGAIQKRAKRDGWQKDLSGAVKAATKARLLETEVAKVASAEVAKRVAKQVASAIPATVEVVAAAAEVNSAVILRHRNDIATLRQLAMDMAAELSLVTHAQDEIRRLQEILAGDATSPDEVDATRRSLDDLLRLHNRVGSAQKLADTLNKLQALERKAFALDDEPGGPGAGAAGRDLTDVERAARMAAILDRARARRDAAAAGDEGEGEA